MLVLDTDVMVDDAEVVGAGVGAVVDAAFDESSPEHATAASSGMISTA